MADWDVNSPSDSDFIAQFPANERAARAALVANFGVDHEANAADANIGKHVKVTLVNQSSDPAATAGQGYLYTKEIGGQSQLFWRSSTGGAVRLTAAGGLRAESLVGTIADERLSSNVPLKDAPNEFSGDNTFSGNNTFSTFAASDATIADLTVTDSITLPARSVADAALSTNVPLKSASNLFDGGGIRNSAALKVIGTGNQSLLYGGDSLNNTDEKYWAIDVLTGTGALRIGTATDTHAFGETAIQISRIGAEVSSIALTADVIRLNGVNVTDYARLSQQNTFTAAQTISAAAPELLLQETDATADNKWWSFTANGEQLRGIVYNDAFVGNNWLVVDRTGNTVDAIALSAADISLSGAVLAPTIATSTSTTLAAGQVHAINGNATLPNMTAGQWVVVINNSASPITVTKNASDTMYWTASGASVTSVTVAARGKVTFFCADGTNVYASGNITGAS